MRYKTPAKGDLPWRRQRAVQIVAAKRISATERADRVFACIVAYASTHGGATPTLAELLTLADISSKSVASEVVHILIELGKLAVIDHKLIVVGAVWIAPER